MFQILVLTDQPVAMLLLAPLHGIALSLHQKRVFGTATHPLMKCEIACQEDRLADPQVLQNAQGVLNLNIVGH